jgi:hypothetical protein
MKTIEERIKKFKDFLNSSSESFDNVISVDYITKNDDLWDGKFSVSNNDYFIKIRIIESINIKKSDKIYICKFGNIDKDGKKNFKKLKDNDLFRGLSALGTIRYNLTEFLKEIDPNVLTFYGSDNDETRIKLYQHFCEEIISKNPSLV